MWALATSVVAVQSTGWLWALGWGGWTAAAIGYGAAWGRAGLRSRIIGAVAEPDQARLARRSLLWDMAAPFLVTWAHLAVQLAAATSRRIRWGGWLYVVRRRRVVRMTRA
jgi:hypothetical protein